jgi:hypothetical protein
MESKLVFLQIWGGVLCNIITSQWAYVTSTEHMRVMSVSWTCPTLTLILLSRMHFKKIDQGGHQWLTPVILTTQEAAIRRIMVQSQARQIVQETLSQKNPSQKRAGGVAQGEGPELKSQYWKNKNKNRCGKPHYFFVCLFGWLVFCCAGDGTQGLEHNSKCSTTEPPQPWYHYG